MAETRSESGEAVVRVLAENHGRFLSFLRGHVATQEEAKDLLQAAFVRSLEKADSIRDDESTVAWFYRLLRNALVDHYRHRDAERRAVERHLRDLPLSTEQEEQLKSSVCACIAGLTVTLKPEYASALKAVDLGEETVGEFGKKAGLTAGNARVRLHRARTALAARVLEMCGTCCQQGCQDCACETPGLAKGKGEV